MKLTAYQVGEPTMDLVPAPTRREWMDASPVKFANRCLPMLMANAYGWDVVLREEVRASWGGSMDPKGVTTSGKGALGHFGEGILTFNVPWLIRTEPGVNTLVRGPANRPKHGIAPLEGLVETDWSDATFTMNWRFTAPGSVVFAAGEPIAMLVPQQRNYLEQFTPAVSTDVASMEAFRAWSADRDAFNRAQQDGSLPAGHPGWQKDYFQGREAPPGVHQRRIVLQAVAG